MSGINKVVLVGHLGKSPEFRKLSSDISVVSFPLATSEVVNVNGIKQEQTEWHNVVMWRGIADVATKLLEKGKLIYLEGKLRTRMFEDKFGVSKQTTEVLAESFTILGRSSDFNKSSELTTQVQIGVHHV
jgi:single-strand DNA-binding protein